MEFIGTFFIILAMLAFIFLFITIYLLFENDSETALVTLTITLLFGLFGILGMFNFANVKKVQIKHLTTPSDTLVIDGINYYSYK